ncbi:hypothetical protein [Mycolicibacterium stellerae]|nr:hypothetical protein [Mycolicibacterium stellerae]
MLIKSWGLLDDKAIAVCAHTAAVLMTLADIYGPTRPDTGHVAAASGHRR